MDSELHPITPRMVKVGRAILHDMVLRYNLRGNERVVVHVPEISVQYADAFVVQDRAVSASDERSFVLIWFEGIYEAHTIHDRHAPEGWGSVPRFKEWRCLNPIVADTYYQPVAGKGATK